MTDLIINNRSPGVVEVSTYRTPGGVDVVIHRPFDVGDLIGKPWRLGARGPDAFDCWGLVLELAERCGRAIPADWLSADMTRAEQRAVMAEASSARTVRLLAPAEGAIAYSGAAAHVGYVLHGRVFHVARGARVVACAIGLWTQIYADTEWLSWQA